MEFKALKCEELAEDANLKTRLRSCEPHMMCEQVHQYEERHLNACMRGYKNALIDTGLAIKDMVVGTGELIEKAWDQMKANKDQRVAFAAQCNKSLACKKNLVKDDPRYSGLADEELNNIPATALLVEVESRAAYLNSIHRSVPEPQKKTADPQALTKDQQDKLMDLAAVLGEQIKQKVRQYQCYSYEAQQEMWCYAVGNVVDPTVLASVAFKAARVAYAAARTVKYGKDAEEISKSVKAVENSFASPRGKFVSKYLNYNPTTPAENAEWIELAKKGKSDGTYFISVENNQMKYLNDTLKDKNVVTSITNFHKKLTLEKLEELQKQYPDLKLTMSSDFKTLNIAGKI
ncbi:MAG: hypothetical protein J7501_16205, partial [Bdellovibrio sp.]|nr:hypothetical protein [Bdellovibrio sp.]